MAGQVNLSKMESRTLSITAGIALLLWFGLLALPWIAVYSRVFELKSEDEVRRVQSVLQQLGTYGDLFGALNCLFSGAALFGVVYAVILQQRDLHHQQETADAARRATDLQNRLSLYQSLVDYHRHEAANAGSDMLLAARSKGRERAYGELMGGLLSDLEAIAMGVLPAQRQTIDFFDHPARIAFLQHKFHEDEGDATDPSNSFAPVQVHLLSLVEEVAALTVLNSSNETAKGQLLEAGHAVNAAIRPQDLLTPEQINDASFHRTYQVRNAQRAFNAADRAIDLLLPAVAGLVT